MSAPDPYLPSTAPPATSALRPIPAVRADAWCAETGHWITSRCCLAGCLLLTGPHVSAAVQMVRASAAANATQHLNRTRIANATKTSCS